MTAAKNPKTTIAFIQWFDASYQRGECTESELITRVEIKSAGLLIREDKESVSIALDRYDLDGSWRNIAHIPKVNIISIRRVKL